MATQPTPQPKDDAGDDSVTGYLRGLSGRIFNWSDADHEKAAKYADDRAAELRDTQSGPRMAKADLGGHIAELERTAKYHRAQMKPASSSSDKYQDHPAAKAFGR